MGARLYNPETGRFLTRDPIPGGNDNTCTYPADPINMFDLSGQWSVPKWANNAGKWAKTNRVRIAAYATVAVGGLACGASIICGAAVVAGGAAVKYATSSRKKKTAAGMAGAILGAYYYRSLGAPYEAIAKSVAKHVWKKIRRK